MTWWAWQRCGGASQPGKLQCWSRAVSNLADWAEGTGTATTGHGGIVATAEAQRWVDGQTRYYHLITDGPGHRLELYASRNASRQPGSGWNGPPRRDATDNPTPRRCALKDATRLEPPD